MFRRKVAALILLAGISYIPEAFSQKNQHLSAPSARQSVFLRSTAGHQGAYDWQMKRVADVSVTGKEISSGQYSGTGWQPAIVPGTVLNSLVNNKVYPEPYYGDNNRRSRKLIPDITDTGNEFYHYWFRTAFPVPETFTGKHIWLKFHGINYRCNIWLNGINIGKMAGMFNADCYDITKLLRRHGKNILAADVLPVDVPGSYYKPGQGVTGAVGENHNGGNGEIGKNVTMLMSVGWDFTAPDGIRDRNTGIWRDVELYATGDVVLQNPYVQSKLPLPDTGSSRETISVELKNGTPVTQQGTLIGAIVENRVKFRQAVSLKPFETKTFTFSPDVYKQLVLHHPKLWWPINKGRQALYTLTFHYLNGSHIATHETETRFGIREITSDQNTPDRSRRFYVNGVPVFIRGTNWVPEAMLRNTEERTYAELRYTRQAGMNFLRLWGGGVPESDYFYQLCDEMGIMVWNEFWLTADTHLPTDTSLYFKNVTSTVKRIRTHASIAYYVGANEGSELPGTGKLIHGLDPNTGYQEESECCGIHDGSPYKYENPMQYFENTASRRGSRVDGFNPEYGTPCVPIVESLRKMMPANNLWPITDSVWNYLDGNGFHQITTKYRIAVNAFGTPASIEEYAKKAQFVGAMNFRAIWEVWNENKFGYGDRWASGYLFWYHNSPLPQTASRLYDWYLEPTAALYYSQNGLSPLHPQFDYLKNTVSVYNDYRRAFDHCTVVATVYNLNAQLVSTQQVEINIPADGLVKDAIKLNFPDQLTQVHFIKLELKDNKDNSLADAFYWRSKDIYKGAWTMTGPAVSGFEEINQLPAAKLKVICHTRTGNNKLFIRAKITNSSKSLAFFTQLKLQDDNHHNLAPTFYTDNFLNLLPGESKTVMIEAPLAGSNFRKLRLITDAFNAGSIKTVINIPLNPHAKDIQTTNHY